MYHQTVTRRDLCNVGRRCKIDTAPIKQIFPLAPISVEIEISGGQLKAKKATRRETRGRY